MFDDSDEDIIDHYAVLSAPDDASPASLRKCYLKASRRYHPDKNPDDPARATKMFNHVSCAYEILSDPVKRKEYDWECGVSEPEHRRSKRRTTARGPQSTRRATRATRARASTADSCQSQRQQMSSAFATSFGDGPGATFESAVHSWDNMMEELLEPVRRRCAKKLQRVWRGYAVRNKYAKKLRRRKKQREVWARERHVLRKAQIRVEKEARRVKTAPNRQPQPHSAKGMLFGPAPPIPRRNQTRKDSKRRSKKKYPDPSSTSSTPPSKSPASAAEQHPFQQAMCMVSAATHIQRAWKQHTRVENARIQRKNALDERNAATIRIQSIFRGAYLRAEIVRASNRAKIAARKRFILRITSRVIVMQARIRGMQTRTLLHLTSTAACKIQRWMNRILEKQRNVSMKKAAHIILCVKRVQSVVRMYRGKRMARSRKIAIKIQRMLKKRQDSIIVLQQAVRRQLERKKNLRTKSAIISIQCMCRYGAAHVAFEEKKQLQKIRKDACFVGNIVQLCFCALDKHRNRKLQYSASTTIVNFFRYAKYTQQVYLVQSAARRYLAHQISSRLRKKRDDLVHVILAQRAVRRWSAHQIVKRRRIRRDEQKQRLILGSTKLQTLCRGFRQRQLFQHVRAQCNKIQTLCRASLARSNLIRRRQQHLYWRCALQIQCWYRCLVAKKVVQVLCAENIRTALALADMQRKHWFEKRSHAAYQLQQAFHRHKKRKAQRQQQWQKHVTLITTLMKVREIIAKNRARKWQQKHSQLSSSLKRHANNTKRLLPSAKLSLVLNLAGSKEPSISPNRSRRQRETRSIARAITKFGRARNTRTTCPRGGPRFPPMTSGARVTQEMPLVQVVPSNVPYNDTRTTRNSNNNKTRQQIQVTHGKRHTAPTPPVNNHNKYRNRPSGFAIKRKHE
jgi:curved DNA-binding protein CbpA